MSRWLAVALLCGCTAAPTPTATPPPVAEYYPQLGTWSYDARRYHLELKFYPDLSGADGTVTMQAEARTDLAEIPIDLDGLEVGKAHLNGHPVEFQKTDDQVLLRPERAVPAGSLFETRVTYSGVPAQVTFNHRPRGWLCISTGETPQCATIGEPLAANRWFPCNNWLEDRAFYSFTLHAPEGMFKNLAIEMLGKDAGPLLGEWVEAPKVPAWDIKP